MCQFNFVHKGPFINQTVYISRFEFGSFSFWFWKENLEICSLNLLWGLTIHFQQLRLKINSFNGVKMLPCVFLIIIKAEKNTFYCLAIFRHFLAIFGHVCPNGHFASKNVCTLNLCQKLCDKMQKESGQSDLSFRRKCQKGGKKWSFRVFAIHLLVLSKDWVVGLVWFLLHLVRHLLVQV